MPAQQAFSPAARLAALLAYPLVILLALKLQEPSLRALSLPLLAILLVGPWPQSWSGRALLLSSLLLAGVIVLVPALALWPPGLICAAASVWFGVSLIPGRTSRIQQFAEAVHGPRGEQLPLGAPNWLRAWTLVWTVLLAGLAVGAMLLAARDDGQWWLIWVFAVIPGATAVTLVLEFLLRHWRFRDYPHLSASEFAVALMRIRPGQLGG